MAEIWRTRGRRLIHRSDRSSQYLSIRYTERLAVAGVKLRVGGVGTPTKNAFAESIIGLDGTEGGDDGYFGHALPGMRRQSGGG